MSILARDRDVGVAVLSLRVPRFCSPGRSSNMFLMPAAFPTAGTCRDHCPNNSFPLNPLLWVLF